MGSESGGRDYSLTEIFAIEFVLADVLIIATLLFAGPLYALAVTGLVVLSGVLVRCLTAHTGAENEKTELATADGGRVGADRVSRDPVTELQKRYAARDLSEDEFEAKLDRLIESYERAEAAGVKTDELSLEGTERSRRPSRIGHPNTQSAASPSCGR
ncbi:SHOCT domain-containing protein [Halosolutus halophilus]|uniref:SHOCT domain-containing protein n=1 Tax=Halosolutus halophilus TaxID=1552990 RepID=UPI002234F962|nr:SHOCT domain-containing protein [Halosolutus halophilus]